MTTTQRIIKRRKKEPLSSRLRRMSKLDDATGCWMWQGAVVRGYGATKIAGKMIRAHRAAYQEFVGEIPEGIFVCHHCDQPLCINPSHLFLGTPSDNMRDMTNKDRGKFKTGERNINAKCDIDMVLSIRQDMRPLRVIAKELGIHFSTVGYIRRQQIWKEVVS